MIICVKEVGEEQSDPFDGRVKRRRASERKCVEGDKKRALISPFEPRDPKQRDGRRRTNRRGLCGRGGGTS